MMCRGSVAEETAGFTDHHAVLFCYASDRPLPVTIDIKSFTSEILVDQTGVAHLECVRLSGRTFTTPALRNLACNLDNDQILNKELYPNLF